MENLIDQITLADLAIKLKPHSHPDPKYSSLYLDFVITLPLVGTFSPPAYYVFVFLADFDKAAHKEHHHHHPRRHCLCSPLPIAGASSALSSGHRPYH